MIRDLKRCNNKEINSEEKIQQLKENRSGEIHTDIREAPGRKVLNMIIQISEGAKAEKEEKIAQTGKQ